MKKTIFIIGTDEKLTDREVKQWAKDLERYLKQVRLTNVSWIAQRTPQGALLAELECGRVSYLALRKRLKEASGGRVMVWKVPGE